MKKLLILCLLTSCGIQHNHEGIPKIPSDVTVNVEHSINLEGIEAFCELQSGHTQDCIDNLITIFAQLLDSSQDSDTSNVASN